MRTKALRIATVPLRLLPPGLGQHRVVRRVYYGRLQRQGETFVRGRVGGRARFELDLSDYVQAQAWLTGRNDPALVRFIAKRLGADGTYVDVGGHIGLIALAVAARSPGARIVALEPHPGNAARFRRNLDLNPGLSVELIEAAVSSEPGEAVLGSHGPGSDYHAIGGPSEQGPRVTVETLDSICMARSIDRIAVLKLDIEGFEPLALLGATRMLDEGRVDSIVLELNDELLAANGWTRQGVTELMAAKGFRQCEIPLAGMNRWRRGSFGYENAAFVR